MANIPLTYRLDWYDPSQPGGDFSAINDNANSASSYATQYTMQDIINTVSYSGGAIDGSGLQYAIPVFTDTNTITNLPTGSAGRVLVSGGAGADPSWSPDFVSVTGAPGAGDVAMWNNANTLEALDGYWDHGGDTLVFGGKATSVGADSTGFGVDCLELATGGDNTCFGHRSGKALTGSDNTAVGESALYAATASASNVAIGASSMSKVATDANENVAVGYESLMDILTGDKNIAIGYRAGQSTTDGLNQILIGHNAGVLHTQSNMTAIGTNACATAVSGVQPITAVGYYAFSGKTTGDRCVGVGDQVGVNADGSGNVFIGQSTGYDCTGSSNTYVGKHIFPVSSGDNNILIGKEAAPSSLIVDNEITLGDSNITALRCAVNTITLISDERDKKDIVDIEYGLDYVKTLQPRQWTWNQRTETVLADPVTKETKEVTSSKNGTKDVGFVAQELQGVDNDFLKLVNDANPDKLQASWVQLVPVLVKAVQELSAKVTVLENK